MKKILLFILIICVNNLNGQCGIYVENTLSRLSNVRFWDQNNGFVIGGATLLTTNDAGNSWSRYELPDVEVLQNNPLNDVTLIGADKAFVVGSNGIIIYTEDNGLNWTRRTGIDGIEDFTSVNFINDQVGYLAGFKDYLVNITPFIYKTIDGGLTWTEISSNINNITTSTFKPEEVHFVDENIGYIWGGASIYKTVNGGETWTEMTNPSNQSIQKIQFIGSQEIYLGNYGFSGLYKSSDAGNSWTQTSYFGIFTVNNDYIYYAFNAFAGITRANLNGGSSNSVGLNQSGFPTDIYFVNDNLGYAVGKREQGIPSMGRFIVKTTDGGLSWTPLDTGAPIGGNVERAHYFKKINENEFVYAVNSSGTSRRSAVLLSKDNGASWQTKYETTDVDGRVLFADGSYMSHFRYSNPNNSGEGYIISESIDKGETWSDGPILYMANLPSGVSFVANSLVQVSTNDLYIYNFGEIYHSVNKGLTWTLIPTPSDVGTRKYQFVDENNFVLYGSHSATSEPIAYITNDGGTTWNLIAQISGYSFNLQFDRFDYSNLSKVYIYPRYPGGKLFTYDTQTQNFTEETIPYFINKIKTIDEDSVMIIDNSENLYISNDNGQSWNSRFWVNNGSLYPEIYVENEDSVYLWQHNFIQRLKKYIPPAPEVIAGNLIVAINTAEDYIIPVNLFAIEEWELLSGGNLILDDQTDFYTARVFWNTLGTHTLRVKRINSCGESAWQEIQVTVQDPLSVPTENQLQAYVIYPNPVKDEFNIVSPNFIKNISIYDVRGSLILEKESNELELTLNIEGFSNGVYFVNIQTDSDIFAHKIIKE